MKTLNSDQAKDINLASSGRTTKISAMIANLKVEEMLIIEKEDWRGKNPPYRIINRVAKKTGRVFQKGRLPDGSGWGVRRLS
jgi:hypothetical protein